MADIQVERKGPSVLPWIIGLVVLALLIWGLMALFGGDDTPLAVTDTARADTAQQAMATDSVERFATFVQQGDTGQMGRQHEYTVEGSRRMLDALGAVVARHRDDAGVQNQFNGLRERIQRLEQSNPESTQHAGAAREVFTGAAAVMDSLSQRLYQGARSQAQETREAARAVRANQPLLEQRESVQRFFQSASRTLQNMWQTRA